MSNFSWIIFNQIICPSLLLTTICELFSSKINNNSNFFFKCGPSFWWSLLYYSYSLNYNNKTLNWHSNSYFGLGFDDFISIFLDFSQYASALYVFTRFAGPPKRDWEKVGFKPGPPGHRARALPLDHGAPPPL